MLIDIERCIWLCFNAFVDGLQFAPSKCFYLNESITSDCALHTTKFVHRIHVPIAEQKEKRANDSWRKKKKKNECMRKRKTGECVLLH